MGQSVVDCRNWLYDRLSDWLSFFDDSICVMIVFGRKKEKKTYIESAYKDRKFP